MDNTGTTGIPVASSPSVPTEQEMSTIRSMFERAANAIVQASELSVKLTELEGRFNALQQDMEAQRRRNQELDEFLTDVRRQRDEARNQAFEAQRKLSDTQAELGHAQELVKSQADEIERLKTELKAAQEDAHTAHESADRAQERAQTAEAKLHEIEEFAQRAFGLAKPQPQPEPAPWAQPEPGEPKPLTVPVPEVDYDRPYHWDHVLNRYVND